MPQVRRFFDSALWLDGGKLREYCDIDTVCDHYAEYVDQINKMKPIEKKKMLEEKFKGRIVKSQKTSFWDKLFK